MIEFNVSESEQKTDGHVSFSLYNNTSFVRFMGNFIGGLNKVIPKSESLWYLKAFSVVPGYFRSPLISHILSGRPHVMKFGI